MKIKTTAVFFVLICIGIGAYLYLNNIINQKSSKKQVENWQYPISPTLNNGKKWRVGYYEGGPYMNYYKYLRAIALGLMEYGWIKKQPIQLIENNEDSKMLWMTLSSEIKSDYLEFVEDAWWSAGWDEKNKRKENTEAVIKKLHEGYLDIIIAAGTWAGQDLANDKHQIPIMVISVSDAVKSGIVKSAADSGRDHVHARIAPDRYLKQIKLFHEIVQFKRLGVPLEHTPKGRTFVGMDGIETIAKERGFQVIPAYYPEEIPDPEERASKFFKAVQKLAPQVDAIVFGENSVMSERNHMEQILKPLFQYGVKSWSLRSLEDVKYGILFSIAREPDLRSVGQFNARVMASILNGVKPKKIEQSFTEPQRIAVNLEAAKNIGFNIPKGLLKVSDIIYKKIER